MNKQLKEQASLLSSDEIQTEKSEVEYDGNKKRDIISNLFEIGMLWRILYGVMKTFLGLSLLKLIDIQLSNIFERIMSHEVSEDPKDLLYGAIKHLVDGHGDFKISYFIAFYFIFWGALDIFLSINLLREKYWAYGTSLFIIGLFVIYEIIRLFHTHSLFLFIVILIDIGILYLIRREQKRHPKT